MTRLVFPDIELVPGELLVPPPVARHARVARVEPGEAVEVLNLAGGVGLGTLVRWNGDGSCVVAISQVLRERGEPPAPLTLALAVLHTQAFDWAVEKATELGVTAVVPVLTSRVQGRDHGKRVSRWQRVAEAAVAQCGRSRAPEVASPVALGDFLAGAFGLRVVADFGGKALPFFSVSASSGVTLLVGPEGGFTGDERRTIAGAGFVTLSLGPRTLRAETAAVCGLAVLQAALGWWTT